MKIQWEKIKQGKPLTGKQKRLVFAAAALLVLILAACYTVFIAPLLEKEQWIYKEETVERGTLKVGVTESGSLEYGIQSLAYDLDLDVSDDDDSSDSSDDEDESDEDTVQKYLRIQEIYVTGGQRITAGDALLKFTEDSISDVRSLLKSAFIDAQSDYAEAEAAYNLSVLEAQTDYDTQKTTESYAATIYQKASTAVDNNITAIQVEIDQKTANIAFLQEKLEEAQKDYNDALEEYEAAKEGMDGAGMDNTVNFMTIQNGYLNAQSKYQQAKSALTQAEQALEDNEGAIQSLQKQLEAAKSGRYLEQLEAEETYQESVISGENAQTTYNAKVESLKETLKEAEDKKNKLEEQLQDFEDFVGEDGILYATEDGIVTAVSYEEGDRLINRGAILSYATPGDMTISVDVTQEDIVDLQVGDPVDITFSAYPEDSYAGVIQSINTTATAANSNTVSYSVVIRVQGDTEQLYGGMTADIIFVTEEKEDVLYISRKAIVEENGKTYVYHKTALGGRELVEVETGITNGVDIEILSGLSEGETIYLASRVSSEEEVRSSSESDSTASDSSGFDGSDKGSPMGGMPGGPGGQ